MTEDVLPLGDSPRKITLIIPAWNEAPSIGGVLDQLPGGLFHEVLVVDNGSTDGTGEIAKAHGAKVVREEQLGYGSACLAGIANGSPDSEVIMFLDADGSQDSPEAPRLLEPILADQADLVIGARRGPHVEKGSLTLQQRWGNTLATWLIGRLYGFRYTDLGPFRAIRRSSLQALHMRDRTFGWTVEMQVKALQNGLRVREVPVNCRVRIGSSKISGNLKNSVLAGTKILWKIFQLRISKS